MLLLSLPRIQTGKLSEFMTTSCFAHLSFLDGKGSSSVSRHADEYDDDDDDDDERDGDGYVHELRCDDGKKRQTDGWMGRNGHTSDGKMHLRLQAALPSLVCPFLYVHRGP